MRTSTRLIEIPPESEGDALADQHEHRCALCPTDTRQGSTEHIARQLAPPRIASRLCARLWSQRSLSIGSWEIISALEDLCSWYAPVRFTVRRLRTLKLLRKQRTKPVYPVRLACIHRTYPAMFTERCLGPKREHLQVFARDGPAP